MYSRDEVCIVVIRFSFVTTRFSFVETKFV